MGKVKLWRRVTQRLRRFVARIQIMVDPPQGIQDWLNRRNVERSAVIVICHPDDETFCSGLISLLVSQGWSVMLVSATRGEGAKLNGLHASQVARVREVEVKRAAAVLGVGRVEFLNLRDPGSDSSPVVECDSDDKARRRLREIIMEVQPSLVVTHGRDGEYGHFGHVKTRLLTIRSLRDSGLASCLLGMNARGWASEQQQIKNRTAPAALWFDAGEYSQQRLKALMCHESQAYIFESWGRGSLKRFIDESRHEFYSLDSVRHR